MKNLLLVVLLIAAAWYLLFDKPAAPPPPAPVAQATPPPPRADYSRVQTFYSPLNDPPVPAGGGNGTYSSAIVLGGTTGTGQRVGNASGVVPTSTGTTSSPEQATSSIGLGGAGNR